KGKKKMNFLRFNGFFNSVSEEGETMKKILCFLGLAFLFLTVASSANAMSITMGDIRMQTTDWSVFEDPVPPGANNPAASGNVWAIFRIDNIADAVGNVTWQSGDGGEYLHGVLGGLTLNTNWFNGTSVVPIPGGLDTNIGSDTYPYSPLVVGGTNTPYHVAVAGLGYVDDEWIDAGIAHRAYFANDSDTGPGFFKIFKSGNDDFIGTASAGYESGIGGGLGQQGTFGGAIISGTPWLEAEFYNPLAIATSEGFQPFGADGVTDVYRADALDLTTAQSTGYLDIDRNIGEGALFDTNTMLGGADMRIESTIYLRDPNDHYGWNGESSGQIFANVVPEPASIMLLGSGLLGLSGIVRRRMRKKH
ncbi:PEP-CTERM sorting domain-containing protein, partial [bacterium]|nr:PEP-CTERM sorting domain-containing protein [bacterium]